MTASIDDRLADLATEQDDVLQDRRRPGRKDVHPSLIPLLRNKAPILAGADPAVRADLEFPVRDDLSASVGIARGLAGMGVVWVGVALLVFHLAH